MGIYTQDYDKCITTYQSNKYIPIPTDKSLITIDETLYRVKEVKINYPCSDDEEYQFEVDVFVEEY